MKKHYLWNMFGMLFVFRAVGRETCLQNARNHTQDQS